MKEKEESGMSETKTTLTRDETGTRHMIEKSCFFAYLDILGFKDIVKRTTFDQLRKLVDEFTSQSLNAIDESRCIKGNQGTIFAKLAFEQCIHVRLVSDSIYVWTENDERLKQFDDMLQAVRYLLVRGFELGLPLRGVVTYGELFTCDVKVPDGVPLDFAFDNGSIYGKALVEAYETEGQMDWSGVVLTPRAWAKVEGEFEKGVIPGVLAIMHSEIKHAEELFNHIPYFVWYDVPFKTGKRKAIVYNWNHRPHVTVSAEMIDKAFKEHGKTMNASAQKKLLETIQFYEYTNRVAELCDFGLKSALPTPEPTYVMSDLLNNESK